MADTDMLEKAVRDVRDALMLSADDPGLEPAIGAILKEVSKMEAFMGEKITQAQIKKAVRDAKKRIIAEAPAPEPEPTREPTVRAIEANGGKVPLNVLDTTAVECRVTGEGLQRAAPMHTAVFHIEARDATGQRRSEGGDAFFVAIRGASRVRARIIDHGDGTYKVDWKPPQSGQYSIAVSFFGVALPGSPWTVHASTPVPFAPHCIAKGGALYSAVARATQTFQVKFKDRLHNTAHAVDLDVYVEPLPTSSPTNSPLGSRPPEVPAEVEPAPLPVASRKGVSRAPSAGAIDKAGGGDGGSSGASAPILADGSRYDMPEPGTGEGSTFVRTRTLRVKVNTSLVIRAKEDIESPQLGLLHPGQMMTVLREFISPGKVRAMISLDSVSWTPEAKQILVRAPIDGAAAALPPAATGVDAGVVDAVADEAAVGEATGPAEVEEEPAETLPPASEAGDDGGKLPAALDDAGVEGDGGGLTTADEPPAGAGNVGWVTLLKDGRKLVTSRVRQSAGSRQQHERQWARRLANDQKAKSQITSAHTVSLELSSDPTGIGFAFGGVHPGTLHAHGHLHDQHNVSYSIGLVGEYLLHVRLRQQAAAIPGSPFNLVVMPGPAHAQSTKLPREQIIGTVGMDPSSGCGVLITTADVMGNACVNGGATVTGNCFGSEVKGTDVKSEVVDRGDGSYYLKWNSQLSGNFNVAIKIDDQHVVGSPTNIKLYSTHPELNKSELSGEGLNAAIAGKPSRFHITFCDQFGNSAVPKDSFKLGLALLKAGEKNKEAKMHDDFNMQLVNRDKGLFVCDYTAKKDGACDLHVWAENTDHPAKQDPDFKADRIPFPGSPFHCVVSAGAANPQRSYVENYTKESKAVDKHGKAVQQDSNLLIAGDSVVFRPHICDELGNAATLPEGALGVHIVYPNGMVHDLNSTDAKHAHELKFTTTSKGGVTTHDIRHEATHAGQHEVHIKLHGEAINGSPVPFIVHESTAEVKMCQLTPPSEHPLYSNNTYVIVLKTFDRFGNPMSRGGLPVSHRLQLIKSGVHDLTTLMPNNNTVEVEDMNDGSYLIKVTLIKITATVKVIVNMDKNIPAAGGELPPVQLTFISAEGSDEGASADGPAAAPAAASDDPVTEEVVHVDASTQNVKLREAGEEVMTLMGIGQEGARAKAGVAVAADAFAAAGAKRAGKNKR